MNIQNSLLFADSNLTKKINLSSYARPSRELLYMFRTNQLMNIIYICKL